MEECDEILFTLNRRTTIRIIRRLMRVGQSIVKTESDVAVVKEVRILV